MSVAATARVPTTHAARYTAQLCKHWAHSLDVEQAGDGGTITFPAEGRSGSWAGPGVLTLIPRADTLECTITASEPAQLAALEDVVARHLDRFAFREALLAFDWQPRG